MSYTGISDKCGFCEKKRDNIVRVGLKVEPIPGTREVRLTFDDHDTPACIDHIVMLVHGRMAKDETTAGKHLGQLYRDLCREIERLALLCIEACHTGHGVKSSDPSLN